MNRNNGREISRRLIVLRDYLFANADKTHSVSLENIRKEYFNAHIMGQDGDYVSIKTVYRDLEALKDNWGVETKYVEKYKGYVLLDPPFEAYELRHIVDSVQASKFITQAEAKRLTAKITEHFGNGRRQNLNRQAYVYDRIRSQNDSVVKETDRLHEAVAANRKISFRFFHMRPGPKKEYSYDGKRIIVRPYALYWNSGNLYLYAYDGKKFRYYRVDRMESISNPLNEEREGKDQYDEKKLTRQQVIVFEMFETGKVNPVKMRFLNTLTDSVMDQFGRDIMMIPDGSEHFTITASVDVSPPFYAWVSSFGRRAKIVSPPEAVEGMKDFLQKSMEMYKDDGNT